MTSSRIEESEHLRRSVHGAEVDSLYQSIVARVVSILTARYVMDESEACSLVETAVHSCRYRLNLPPADAKAWIEAAVFGHAELQYAKRPAPAGAGAEGREITQKGLLTLGPDARCALWLRYKEHWEFEAIAVEMKVTVKYVHRLLISSLNKLRSLQRQRARRRP